MELRPVIDSDKEAIVALIDGIYRDYGDRICLENADQDLVDIPGHYGPGLFQVLEDQGTIHGTVALVLAGEQPGVCFLKRLYLDPDLRGGGWGSRMIEWVIEQARARDMRRMELWTDTRFTRAHAFYRKLGFGTNGAVRTMDDGWVPYKEHFFYLDL